MLEIVIGILALDALAFFVITIPRFGDAKFSKALWPGTSIDGVKKSFGKAKVSEQAVNASEALQSKLEEKPALPKTKLEEVKNLLLFEQVPGKNSLNIETVKAYETFLQEDAKNVQIVKTSLIERIGYRDIDNAVINNIYAQIPEDAAKFKELFSSCFGIKPDQQATNVKVNVESSSNLQK